MIEAAYFHPPRHGRGDQAQHGGGGVPDASPPEGRALPPAPSTPALRGAVPLSVPGRITRHYRPLA
jgi:hypothetical protein